MGCLPGCPLPYLCLLRWWAAPSGHEWRLGTVNGVQFTKSVHVWCEATLTSEIISRCVCDLFITSTARSTSFLVREKLNLEPFFKLLNESMSCLLLRRSALALHQLYWCCRSSQWDLLCCNDIIKSFMLNIPLEICVRVCQHDTAAWHKGSSSKWCRVVTRTAAFSVWNSVILFYLSV